MYKALLCWRYLRTRFLAFVCIVSVMLGVATLVVVNSVMAGFSTKLKDRFHGLMSDVIVESPSYNGFTTCYYLRNTALSNRTTSEEGVPYLILSNSNCNLLREIVEKTRHW